MEKGKMQRGRMQGLLAPAPLGRVIAPAPLSHTMHSIVYDDLLKEKEEH